MSRVVIIGAGPAGISAAKTLAQSDQKVFLLDRHEHPGKKACAGGLTRDAWELAGIDPTDVSPLGQCCFSVNVETRLGRATIREGESPLLVIVDRPAWQQERIDELVQLGVQVCFGDRLLAIENDAAITENRKWRFDWLIGADGASSRVRRHVGLPTKMDMKARQVRISRESAVRIGLDGSNPTVWFIKGIPAPGYGWAFPFGDEMRIGFGAGGRGDGSIRLHRGFDAWLQRIGLNGNGAKQESGSIPCDYRGYRFGRIFLAGDAAGLASPLTGEGIAQALISGREVAREILDPNYQSESIAQLAIRHRRTQYLLSHSFLGGPAMQLAPYLLRIPFIRKQTQLRYV